MKGNTITSLARSSATRLLRTGSVFRRLLVSATVLGVVGAAGFALAHPRHQNNTGPAKPGAARPTDPDDSVQITMTAGKGRLGISVLQISSELRQHLGAPADRGVLVNDVRPDSPAAKAGLHVGDAIVEVDGDAAHSASDILGAMSDRKKGDAIKIEVVRDHNPLELTATLDDDPGPARISGGGSFGGTIDPNDPQLRAWLRKLPDLGGLGGPGSAELQRQLDEANRRIEALERRLDKLGTH